MKIKTSSISANMVLSCTQFQIDESNKIVRSIQYNSINGVNSDINLTGSSYNAYTNSFSPSADNSQIPVYPYLEYDIQKPDGSLLRNQIKFPTPFMLSKDDIVSFHGKRQESQSDRFTYKFQVNQGSAVSHITPPLRMSNKSSYFSWHNRITPDLYLSMNKDEPVQFGGRIIFPEIHFRDKILLVHFKGQNHEILDNLYTCHYKFNDQNNETLKFDSLTTGSEVYNFSADLEDDCSMEYYLKNHFPEIDSSIAKLTLNFKQSDTDKFPPTLTSLQARNSDGIPRDHFEGPEKISIRFSLKDQEDNLQEKATKLFIKDFNGEEWSQVKLTHLATDSLIGRLYSGDVDLSEIIDSGLVSLKIDFGDNSNNLGQWHLKPAFSVGNFITTDIKGLTEGLPKNYRLYQNYPNPFNPITRIKYSLPHHSEVVLRIYDLRGRLIRTLVEEYQKSGNYQISWNGHSKAGTKVPSGIYFYRIIARTEATEYLKTRKMIFLE